MHYHGQMGLQIALLVALTQLIPEHQVQLFGVLKARVKVLTTYYRMCQLKADFTGLQSLPMVYLTISCILCLFGFQCPWILVQFGWFVGWVYLRFYKKTYVESLAQDTFGDRSETFSLVSWFPPFMQCALLLYITNCHDSKFQKLSTYNTRKFCVFIRKSPALNTFFWSGCGNWQLCTTSRHCSGRG